MSKTKRCSKCKEEKSRSEFYKRKRSSDGLCGSCKACGNKSDRKYREANPEKLKEKSRKYKETNREKVKEYDRKYREASPEKVKEWNRKYYEANAEKEKEAQRKQVSNLSNMYVRQLIRRKYKVPNEYISEELIEDYRKLLILERQTNERRKEEQRKIIKRRIVRSNRKRRA